MGRAVLVCYGASVMLVASMSIAAVVHPKVEPPSPSVFGAVRPAEPMVLSSGGDTTWLQVHNNTSYCPGDPNLGHGGETTGGPGPLETWCFEGGPGDSCGTNPPWDTNCFKHVDVRAIPSAMNINYWHVDSYRTDQRAYCGSRALWCGSPALWNGQPVECGTWQSPPGYGDSWYCNVQLDLPASFDVAGGCTVCFDPRYDAECKYDYFYVDYLSIGPAPTYKQTWKPLAAFNATSSNPGATCGGTAPNPDYWGNTDAFRLLNCDWQDRSNPSVPAFAGAVTPAMFGTCVSAPKLRWRFVSDASASDADGRIDTDGAAFVDNVMVYGDAGDFYSQDFETCAVYGALPEYWSTPNPAGVLDAWHIRHDSDPPYEGGDGGERTTCMLDSSYMWRARPEKGYPSGVAWRNGWYYRLMTPRVPIGNTGCVVQYDDFPFWYEWTCDYTNIKVRFYDQVYNAWCPWTSIYDGWLTPTSINWSYDVDTDVSQFYGGTADSMQFAWELMDVSIPTWTCRGKHDGTQFLVDNVSIGFYDANATCFFTRGVDLLHDTFATGVCGYDSYFDSYSPDTVIKYSGTGAPPLPKEQQFNIDVIDEDDLALVQLLGSADGGSNWVARPMTLDEPDDPSNPARGGLYCGTLCPTDFGLAEWAEGTEVWYYVKATDALANVEYYPSAADPAHPRHSGAAEDYLEFSILPMFSPGYAGPKILLVDGRPGDVYDYAPCVGATDSSVLLENLYEQTLTDAGYCFDKYDINGAGSAEQNQPIEYADYDAVVWFTGPRFDGYLFDGEAQHALDDYLAGGGKVMVCGDRIAFHFYYIGDDSLGGCFVGGVLGIDYLDHEMPSPFDHPFVYSVGVDSLDVLGSRIAVGLDTLLIYRSCPYLKDMSYVLANAGAGACGYTAQPLMYIANPTVVAQADEVIYSEHTNGGQCVYVNFDLSASVNHTRGYCSGDAATPAPDFDAGTYDGRVELVRVILEDIFGLASSGGAGVPEVAVPDGPDRGATCCWVLGQNNPNPCVSSTQISYEVARPGAVRLRVFDAMGRLVRTLVDDVRGPGRYVATWNGADRAGRRVSSGVYFYTMEAAGYKATRKMLVVQ